jgi:hypothetical protein
MAVWYHTPLCVARLYWTNPLCGFGKGTAHEVYQGHQVQQDFRGSEVEGSAVRPSALRSRESCGIMHGAISWVHRRMEPSIHRSMQDNP